MGDICSKLTQTSRAHADGAQCSYSNLPHVLVDIRNRKFRHHVGARAILLKMPEYLQSDCGEAMPPVHMNAADEHAALDQSHFAFPESIDPTCPFDSIVDVEKSKRPMLSYR